MKTVSQFKPEALLSTVLFCAFLALSACQSSPFSPTADALAQPPLLNSERIRQKYGSYGVEVLEADERLRVANLYSSHEGERVTRTLAIVLFSAPIPKAILPEHELIIAGGSIGEVFKHCGWQVEKENLYFDEIQAAPENARLYEMMGEIPPTDLAVHGYELFVSKNTERFSYTTIVEIHHPDYLNLDELEAIYIIDGFKDSPRKGLPAPALEIVRDALSSF